MGYPGQVWWSYTHHQHDDQQTMLNNLTEEQLSKLWNDIMIKGQYTFPEPAFSSAMLSISADILESRRNAQGLRLSKTESRDED